MSSVHGHDVSYVLCVGSSFTMMWFFVLACFAPWLCGGGMVPVHQRAESWLYERKFHHCNRIITFSRYRNATKCKSWCWQSNSWFLAHTSACWTVCHMYILWFGAFLQLLMCTLNFHVIYASSYKFRVIYFI